MKDFVSIIIPHFNRTALLSKTIESILDQTSLNWEAIVIDDQSDQGEWEKLQRFASEKITVLQRKKGKKGPAACRNLGVEHAKGKYLLFLDSDDLLAPFCVEQRIAAMKDHPEADACVFLMKQFERCPVENGRLFNLQIDEGRWMASFIKNENPWNVTCPIWKKEAFLQIGGFDETFFYMEDPELHVRAIHHGLKFITMYHLPADCFYRVHNFDETKSRFYYNSIHYRIKFYRKLTSGAYPKTFVLQHKSNIKKGVNTLIKTFLYSRKNEFGDLYNLLMNWTKSSGLFSRIEIFRYHILLDLGNANHSILKRLKLKGLCYKLLPE